MAATITDAGNLQAISGTLADVMAALKGKPKSSIIAMFHDGTNYVAIVARTD